SAIGSFGYALERVPYARWRERLAGPDGQDNSLRPLMFLFPPEERPQDGVSETSMGAGAGPPRFAWEDTGLALSRASITCPKADAELVHAVLAYFVRSGFLPSPRNRSNVPREDVRAGAGKAGVEEASRGGRRGLSEESAG